MEIHLIITGIVLIGLFLLHFIFPKYFKWKEELSNLSLINRQMMQVHSFFIAFVVFLMGILCISSAEEIISTPFGKKISLGLGIFWIVRLAVQLFVYSSKNWRGKRFETGIHIFFCLLWMYFSFTFLSNALSRCEWLRQNDEYHIPS